MKYSAESQNIKVKALEVCAMWLNQDLHWKTLSSVTMLFISLYSVLYDEGTPYWMCMWVVFFRQNSHKKSQHSGFDGFDHDPNKIQGLRCWWVQWLQLDLHGLPPQSKSLSRQYSAKKEKPPTPRSVRSQTR